MGRFEWAELGPETSVRIAECGEQIGALTVDRAFALVVEEEDGGGVVIEGSAYALRAELRQALAALELADRSESAAAGCAR